MSEREATQPDNLKDIFLSYNKTDKKWVLDLAASIESETLDRTPASRKLRVFLDEWDMDVGDNIISKMNEGLKASHFFAVVMSQEFFGSGCPNFEWTHVVSQDPTNAKRRIIPIFLRDASLDGKRRIEFSAPFNVEHRTPKRRRSRKATRPSDVIEPRPSASFLDGFGRTLSCPPSPMTYLDVG